MPIAKYAPLSLKIRKAIGKLIKAPNIPVIGIAIRGLNPENISDAVDQTGAAFLDLNSGIEVAPGIKDSSLLRKALGSLGRA